MSIEVLASSLAIALALLSFATVVFNAGRYGEKISRMEKHTHELRSELATIMGKLVTKEVYERDLIATAAYRATEAATLKEKLTDIKEALSQQNDTFHRILLTLGQLGVAHEEISRSGFNPTTHGKS